LAKIDHRPASRNVYLCFIADFVPIRYCGLTCDLLRKPDLNPPACGLDPPVLPTKRVGVEEETGAGQNQKTKER
jgi:hypothetical protein